MHFRHLDSVSLLIGLAVLAVAALAIVLAARGRRRVLAELARPPLAGKLVSSLAPARRRIRHWLFFAGAACLLLALARPWWGTRLTAAPRHSRDLLFAVDVSRSMLARDVPPSRLEHAKWFVREVARRSPGDRFGLIAFAGDAMLECPLTQDINTLFQFLDTLDTRSAAVGGTNLAKALEVARQAFAGAESGHRAVLLLSDGEELEGHAAAETAYFKEQDIPLFVVGIGDPAAGSMIQLGDGAFVRDAAGKMVASKLNESGLRALAEATGGIYVRSTALDANVGPVEARVKSLVPAEHAGGTRRAPIERFQWPLALGLLCLLARLLLGERRPAPRPATPAVAALTAMLGAALLAAGGDAWGQTAAPAPALMPPLAAKAPAATSATPAGADAETQRRRQEENQQAITVLAGELAKAPAAQKARLHYNLGCRYQFGGDNPRARQEYEAALAAATDPPFVRGFAQQNLGVLRHNEARDMLARDPKAAIAALESARQWYREALRLLPGNEIPAANLERLEHDIEAARQLEQFMKQFQQQLEKARQETAKAAQAQAAANQPPPDQEAKPPQPREPARQQKDADRLQEAANQQTQASQKAVETLVNQSGKNLKPEAAKQFQQAADEIRQAAAAQQQRQGPRSDTGKQAAGQQAEQHLRQAVKLLGGEQPPPDQQQQQSGQQKPPDQPKDGKDQQKQNQNGGQNDDQRKKPDQGDKKDGKPDNSQDRDKQQNQAGQPQANEEFSLSKTGTDGKPPEAAKSGAAGKEEKAIDPNQAAALMQGMLEQEKDLREAIKEQRRGTMPEPDKDW